MRRIDVLGVHISAVDEPGAVSVIADAVNLGLGGYVCVTGVHGVMESQRDPQLRQIHNASLLTVPDGMPMVWCGHRAGAAWVRRVYGPDLMLAVLEKAAQENWASYFYGGAVGVADALVEELSIRFPGLRCVGTYTPPFRQLTTPEEADVTRRLAAAAPQLVWVGLSTPKQERWMARFAENLPGVVFIGVGAAFDFHTGRLRQAPPLLQRVGLEWLFRLAVEPRRLWRRYARNNPAFVAALLRRPPRLLP